MCWFSLLVCSARFVLVHAISCPSSPFTLSVCLCLQVNAKLSDYGIACYATESGLTQPMGTAGCRAPELLAANTSSMPYNDKVCQLLHIQHHVYCNNTAKDTSWVQYRFSCFIHYRAFIPRFPMYKKYGEQWFVSYVHCRVVYSILILLYITLLWIYYCTIAYVL